MGKETQEREKYFLRCLHVGNEQNFHIFKYSAASISIC